MTTLKFFKSEFPEQFDQCFEVWIGDGWLNIVYNLTKQIRELTPEFKVLQVKEKFGGLRYYLTCEDKFDEIEALVKAAEAKCDTTCENCGSTTDVTTEDSWLKTLCDKCRERKR